MLLPLGLIRLSSDHAVLPFSLFIRRDIFPWRTHLSNLILLPSPLHLSDQAFLLWLIRLISRFPRVLSFAAIADTAKGKGAHALSSWV